MENKRAKIDHPDASLIGDFSLFPWEITQLIWDYIVDESLEVFANVCKTFHMYYTKAKQKNFDIRLGDNIFMRIVINAVVSQLMANDIVHTCEVSTLAGEETRTCERDDGKYMILRNGRVQAEMSAEDCTEEEEIRHTFALLNKELGGYCVIKLHFHWLSWLSEKSAIWKTITSELSSATSRNGLVIVFRTPVNVWDQHTLTTSNLAKAVKKVTGPGVW